MRHVTSGLPPWPTYVVLAAVTVVLIAASLKLIRALDRATGGRLSGTYRLSDRALDRQVDREVRRRLKREAA